MESATVPHSLQNILLLLRDLSAYTTVFIFLAFGTWSLHKRFQKHEEWPLRTQMLVLSGVAIFYLLEIPTLSYVLRESVIQFIFALLGLLVAGLSLYGHIIVSVISRLLVEFLVPDNPAAAVTPRLGPAEALERQEDWEGALNEYYVLARIYPRNALICVRAANNLLRLDRGEEAVVWFERAIKYTDKAEDNLVLVRRLCDTLETLHQPERINEILRRFAERFSDHESARTVIRELTEPQRRDNVKEACPADDMLVPLEDAPLTPDDRR